MALGWEWHRWIRAHNWWASISPGSALCSWWEALQSVEHQVALRNVKWLTQYLCHRSTEIAEIFFLATSFQDVGLAHAKFQLSITCTFRAVTLLVDESVISAKLTDISGHHSSSLKVQVIKSWNFAMNFSHAFLLRYGRDIGWATWRSTDCTYVYNDALVFSWIKHFFYSAVNEAYGEDVESAMENPDGLLVIAMLYEPTASFKVSTPLCKEWNF